MEISNLPDKEFKVMVIKMVTNSGEEWMNMVSTSTKEIENIRKYQTEGTELKNTITKLKSTQEGFTAVLMKQKKGSVIWKTEHWDSPKQSSKKKKRILKSEDSLRNQWDNIK